MAAQKGHKKAGGRGGAGMVAGEPLPYVGWPGVGGPGAAGSMISFSCQSALQGRLASCIILSIRNDMMSIESTTTFDSPRPDFTDPPVVEVLLSVQFEPLSELGVPQLGALWSQYKEEFPKTEDKPPLASIIESFEPPKHQPINVEFISEPPPPRCWFMNTGGTSLIQVQRDRFVFNWRESSDQEPYPRYENVREDFKRHFDTFEKYMMENNIGGIIPNQCEVTYVNHIVPSKEWNRWGQAENIFSLWSGRHSDQFLGEPEDVRFQMRYRMNGDNGEPLGRLHVAAEPRTKIGAGSPLIRLTMTARGAPAKKEIGDVMAFFDIGREFIVRGFASITTAQMHRIWGRTDA